MLYKGGFSAAGMTYEGHILAVGYLKGDIVQRPVLKGRAGGIYISKVFDNYGHIVQADSLGKNLLTNTKIHTKNAFFAENGGKNAKPGLLRTYAVGKLLYCEDIRRDIGTEADKVVRQRRHLRNIKGEAAQLLLTGKHLSGGALKQDAPLRHNYQTVGGDGFLHKMGYVHYCHAAAAQLLHAFFAERGFVYVHTPIITGSDCEGAGAMFQVTTLPLEELAKSGKAPDYKQDFFGKKASLTVSGQLNAETYAMAFSNVYTFGPTFRAEHSNTARHAAEFWMIEPEMAFCDLAGDMDVAEAMVKYIISYVGETCKDELDFLNKFVDTGLLERLKNVTENDFVRLPYTEGVKILEESGHKFEYPVYWGADLQSEHERFLVEEHFKKPVILTDYPKEIKAFYMKMNDDGKTVRAMDVLFPRIGEIIGGSQREENYDKLLARIEELHIPMKDMWWYLDTRRFGTAPHSGFGLGFERLLLFVTGMTNIRDVIPFPRTPKNAEF